MTQHIRRVQPNESEPTPSIQQAGIEFLPLRVVCFLFDPAVGGPTIRARSVYRCMRAAGHEITIAFPREKGPALEYVRAAGIEAVRLPIAKPVPPSRFWLFLNFVLGLPLYALRVRSFLRKVRPQVVHVNGAFDIVPAIGAKLAGVPIVWHLNDMVFGPTISYLLGKLVSIVADVVAATCGAVADHYGVRRDTTFILYPPVQVDELHQSPRDFPAWASRSPRIGLIANWNWIKGHEDFVDSVIGIAESDGLSPVGVVMGKKLDTQRRYWEPILKKIDLYSGNADFEILGFVPDVRARLDMIDLVLVTSRSEAGPMSALDAMASGIPVVGYDVGAMHNFLLDGDLPPAGIIVGRGDVKGLIAAIRRLLGDPALYEAMSAAALERVRTRFNVSACSAAHELVYRRAVLAGGTDSDFHELARDSSQSERLER